MLHNILNIDGIEVLNKKQQVEIAGGGLEGTTCTLRIINHTTGLIYLQTVHVLGWGEEAYQLAQQECPGDFDAGCDVVSCMV